MFVLLFLSTALFATGMEMHHGFLDTSGPFYHATVDGVDPYPARERGLVGLQPAVSEPSGTSGGLVFAPPLRPVYSDGKQELDVLEDEGLELKSGSFAPPPRSDGLLRLPAEKEEAVDVVLEEADAALTRLASGGSSGFLHTQEKPVCWSYSSSTVLRANSEACEKIPGENPSSKEQVGLVKSLRVLSGMPDKGTNEYLWQMLFPKLNTTLNDVGKTRELWAKHRSATEKFLAPPEAFQQCLQNIVYWSTKDFNAVWDRLPTCGPDIDASRSSLQRSLEGLFHPDAIEKGRICPFAHDGEETFVLDAQWSYVRLGCGLTGGSPKPNREEKNTNQIQPCMNHMTCMHVSGWGGGL